MAEERVAGDRVRLPEGFRLRRVDGGLVVDCPFEPPGWTPRKVGDQIRADFPGSAVRYDGELFEVVSGEGRSDSDGVRYRLEPWDDRCRMGPPVDLGPEACRAWHRRFARIRLEEKQAHTLSWLAPLAGLLPAADQEALESRLGVSAGRATLLSAGLFLLLSLPTAAFGLVVLLVPDFAADDSWLQVLPALLLPAAYLGVESWVRFNIVMSEWRPVGSLPVVLAVKGIRALRALLM